MTRTKVPGEPLKALVLTAYFEPGVKGGGPIRSIASIISTCDERIEVRIVCRDRDLGDEAPYPGLSGRWVRWQGVDVFYLHPFSLPQVLTLLKELRRWHPDLVYLNSLFDPMFSIAPVFAAYLRMMAPWRLLIAPRGELSPGALNLHWRRKRVYLTVARHVLSSVGARIHATSELEAREIARELPALPQRVVTEGSLLSPRATEPVPSSGAALRVAFVSRISPKKQPDLLLRALALCTEPMRVTVAGPIEDSALWSRCLALIDTLPPHVTVEHVGLLKHADVVTMLSRNDVFAFPTAGENHGHVIAESLNACCPVVTGDVTPWSQLLREGGGSVLAPLDAPSLAAELDRRAAATPSERLDARRAAGDAYERWRANEPENVLVSMRDNPW